MDHIMIAIT